MFQVIPVGDTKIPYQRKSECNEFSSFFTGLNNFQNFHHHTSNWFCACNILPVDIKFSVFHPIFKAKSQLCMLFSDSTSDLHTLLRTLLVLTVQYQVSF